jgi:hypothetical protein
MFAASKSAKAAAAAAATDPSFAYVPLLLNTTSTNGQQNNTFLDSSSNTFTITRNGTPTQGSITPYWPNGQWSNYFNGSTDSLTAASNAAFTLGASSNNFTIEFWAYANGLQAANAVLLTTWVSFSSGFANRWSLNFSGSASSSTLIWNNSSGSGLVVTTSFPINAWTHVAVVRNAATINVYINGVSLLTQTTNQDYSTQGALSVGYVSGGGYFNGYISNARLANGTAVYTGAFTPPTVPLTATTGGTNPPTGTQCTLLTCQSNRFIDNSSTHSTITVNGTPEFKAQMIRAAVDSQLPITFADPGLELRRQELLNKKEQDDARRREQHDRRTDVEAVQLLSNTQRQGEPRPNQGQAAYKGERAKKSHAP